MKSLPFEGIKEVFVVLQAIPTISCFYPASTTEQSDFGSGEYKL